MLLENSFCDAKMKPLNTAQAVGSKLTNQKANQSKILSYHLFWEQLFVFLDIINSLMEKDAIF